MSRIPLIILTGGGTGGSVTPLITIQRAFASEPIEWLWVGTHHGVERAMVKEAGLRYDSITSAKWDRWWTIRRIAVPWRLAIGWFESIRLLRRVRPLCVVGAGSFVQVPLCWAAWMLNIPIMTIQLDEPMGLANRVVLPIVRRCFTVFPSTAQRSNNGRVVCVGSIVEIASSSMHSRSHGLFHLNSSLKTLFVVGGGTGSVAINNALTSLLPLLLPTYNIIHSSGGRLTQSTAPSSGGYQGVYVHRPLLNRQEMECAYRAADVIVSRAGAATIMELAFWKKSAIMIPLPHSPQVRNVEDITSHQAAVIIDQERFTPSVLKAAIDTLVQNEQLRSRMGLNLSRLFPSTGLSIIKTEIESCLDSLRQQ